MKLAWTEEHTDQRVALFSEGEYRVGDADSLGQREVTFSNKDGNHFVGIAYTTDDGIARAENHAAWVMGLRATS